MRAAVVETSSPKTHTFFNHNGSFKSPVITSERYPRGKPIILRVKTLSILKCLSNRKLGRPKSSIPSNANGYVIGINATTPDKLLNKSKFDIVRINLALHSKERERKHKYIY
jgi:hypothetical protein